MKNKRYIKHVMGEFGYNNNNVILTGTDNAGYIYFTDENGVQLKVKYDSVAPINVDPTNWDYEGILTSDTYADVVFGYFEFVGEGGETVQYGSIDPLDTNINIFGYLSDEKDPFSANTLIFKLNNNYRSTLDEININIDGELYNVVEKYFDDMGFAYIIENVMVNPLTVGNHDIKIRYGELITLSDNTDIKTTDENVVSEVDNTGLTVTVMLAGITTVGQVRASLSSDDGSTQTYTFYNEEGIEIEDDEHILGKNDYLIVTAEDETTAEYTPALSYFVIGSFEMDLPIGVEIMPIMLETVGSNYTPIVINVSSGSLPDGLTLANNTITGTPTRADNGSFRLQATDAEGNLSERSFIPYSVFDVLAWDMGGALPEAAIGEPYNILLFARGGQSPYTFSLVEGSGSLPEGLSINQNQLEGNPISEGKNEFTLRVTDNNRVTADLQCTLDVVAGALD
jgi:hypothetical protein